MNIVQTHEAYSFKVHYLAHELCKELCTAVTAVVLRIVPEGAAHKTKLHHSNGKKNKKKRSV